MAQSGFDSDGDAGPDAGSGDEQTTNLLRLDPESDPDADMGNLDGDQRRTYRARTERMVVIPRINADDCCTGLYDVVSASGTTYTVGWGKGQSECKDAMFNNPEHGCKHRRRVEMMVEEAQLPAPNEDASEYLSLLESTFDDLLTERERLLEELELLNHFISEVEDSPDTRI